MQVKFYNEIVIRRDSSNMRKIIINLISHMNKFKGLEMVILVDLRFFMDMLVEKAIFKEDISRMIIM